MPAVRVQDDSALSCSFLANGFGKGNVMASSLGFNGGLTCALKVTDLENALMLYQELKSEATERLKAERERLASAKE